MVLLLLIVYTIGVFAEGLNPHSGDSPSLFLHLLATLSRGAWVLVCFLPLIALSDMLKSEAHFMTGLVLIVPVLIVFLTVVQALRILSRETIGFWDSVKDVLDPACLAVIFFITVILTLVEAMAVLPLINVFCETGATPVDHARVGLYLFLFGNILILTLLSIGCAVSRRLHS